MKRLSKKLRQYFHDTIKQSFFCLIGFAIFLVSDAMATLEKDRVSCLEKSVKESEVLKEDLAQFIKLQSEITLHRLALQYLKQFQSSEKTFQSLEDQILSRMEKRNKDQNFLKVYENLKKYKKRRTFLSEALKAVPDLFSMSPSNSELKVNPFELHDEDFILIGMYAEVEEKYGDKSSKSIFSNNTNSIQSILDFAKIIDSSYRTRNLKNFTKEQIRLEIESTQDVIQSLHLKNEEMANQLLQKTKCGEFYQLECVNCNETPKKDSQKFIQDLLSTLSKEDPLYENQLARYGEVWLKVSEKGQSNPIENTVVLDPSEENKEDHKNNKTDDPFETPLEDQNSTKKVKKTRSSPPAPKKKNQKPNPEKVEKPSHSLEDGPLLTREKFRSLPNDLNFPLEYIENPGSVIRDFLKNGYNIDKDFKNEKDEVFLLKWANGIIRKDKIFYHNGKFYSLISKNAVIQKIPGDPLSDTDLLQYGLMPIVYDSKNLEMKKEVILATINDKKSLIFKNEFYRIQTMTNRNRATEYSNTNSDQKILVKIPKEKVFNTAFPKVVQKTKLDQEYILVRANAKLNGDLTFKYKEKVFRTETGRSIQSPIEKKLEDENKVHVTYNEVREKEDKINLLSTPREKLDAYKKYFPYSLIPKDLKENDFYVKDGKINIIKNEKEDPDEILNQRNKCFHPITSIKSYDQNVPPEIAVKFLNTLKEKKGELLNLYSLKGYDGSKPVFLTNEDYNELVQIAYGIVRNESFMGEINRNIKEYTPDLMLRLAKYVVKNVKYALNKTKKENASWDAVKNLSNGLPQIKKVPNRVAVKYGIEASDLYDPEKAALATFGFLVQSLEELRNIEKNNPNLDSRINPMNRKDFLIYLYNSTRSGLKKDAENPSTPETNIYIQNIKKSKELIVITESKTSLPFRDLKTKCQD